MFLTVQKVRLETFSASASYLIDLRNLSSELMKTARSLRDLAVFSYKKTKPHVGAWGRRGVIP